MFTKLSVLLFWDNRDQKLNFQVLIFILLNNKMQEIQKLTIREKHGKPSRLISSRRLRHTVSLHRKDLKEESAKQFVSRWLTSTLCSNGGIQRSLLSTTK